MNSNVSYKEKGKLLAAFAVLALVVCAFVMAIPITDAESDTLPEASEGVITLTDDTVVSDPIVLNGETLDLAGFTLSAPGITMYGGGITDSTYADGATNTINLSGSPGISILGTASISDVTIAAGGSMATSVGYGVSASFDNVTVTGDDCYTAVYYCVTDTESTLTISGCDFGDKLVNYDTAAAESAGTVNITGSTGVALGVLNNSGSAQTFVFGTDGQFVVDSSTELTTVMVGYEGQAFTVLSVTENLACDEIVGPGSISTDDTELVDCENVEVTIVSGTTAIVSTYDALITAINSGATEITVSGTIDVTDNLVIDMVSLDLTDAVLNMGEYAIDMTNSSITGGVINGVGQQAANGGDFVIITKYNTSITGTTINMSAPEGGILPYAAINVDPTCIGAIRGVTFNAESSFDSHCAIAVQYYTGSGNITIDGCTLNDGGVIQYNNMSNAGTVLTIANMDGITLNLLGNITSQNLILNNSSVAQTIVGWDASMASTNLSDNAETNVSVNGDFDFGTISTGDDPRNGTQGMTVLGGTVTANGGSLDALTITDDGEFITSERFEVDLLTIDEASQMPENLVPQDIVITQQTAVRPVASDFVVVQYEPAYYTGEAQGPHYYIRGPQNVVIESITIVNITNTPQTKVGTYVSNLTVSFAYTLGDTSDSTTVDLVLNWEIVRGESTIDINTPQDSDITVTDGQENTFIVDGELTYDNGYVLTIPGVTTDKNVTLTPDMFTGPEGFSYENGSLVIRFADEVPAELNFNVDFDGNAGTDNWTTSTYTLVLSGLTLNRDAEIGIWEDGETTVQSGPQGSTTTIDVSTNDLFFGSDEDYTLDVTTSAQSADVRYQYDAVFTGGLKYVDGADRYYLPIEVTGLLDGATVTINGYDATVADGTATGIVRITADLTAFWIVVDQDGEGTTFDAVTYRANVADVVLQSAVDITAGQQDSYYDMALGNFGEDIAAVQDGFNVTFTGNLNYLVDYNGYSEGAVGWFLPWDVTTPIYGADIANATGSMNGGEAQTNIQNNVTRINSAQDTFVVDLDGNGTKYIPATYTFTNNVDSIAVGGYNEIGYQEGNTDTAWQEMQDLGFVNVPTNDVAPQTMYIAFNPMGNTSGTYTLQLNGESLTIRDGENGWSITNADANAVVVYFTFDRDNEHWNGLDIAVGTYTVTILNDAGTELGTAQVPVGGLLGYGYDESASVVTEAMHNLGADVSDVIANTMYIVWNNDSAVTGEVTGYLYKMDENGQYIQIWNQSPADDGSDVWNQPGIHSWYFSFNDELADWAADNSIYGKYRMVIAVDEDIEGSEIYGEIDVIDKTKFTVYLDEGWFDFPDGVNENEDVYDVTLDMTAGDRLYLPETAYVDETLLYWALVDGNNEVIRTYSAGSLVAIGQIPGVTGQEYHFVAVYEKDPAGISTDMPTEIVADGEWNQFTVSTTTGDYAGTTILGHFTTNATGVSIQYIENDGQWHDLVTDYFGPSTGFDLDNVTSYFQIKATVPGDYSARIWIADIQGNVLAETVVEFTVTTVEPDTPVSEHSIAYWVAAALEDSDYGFLASYNIAGTDVTAIYEPDVILTLDENLMNDFARYMGAVYRVADGDIVSVYFNGNTYVWCESELGLDGSNWARVDTDGNVLRDANDKPYTLTRDATDFVLANIDTLSKNSIALELTNAAGDKAVLNYGIAVFDSSSEQGYAQVRQLDDYYLVIEQTADGVKVTLKTDLIEGYRNVLESVMFSFFDWNDDTNDGSWKMYIDEPGTDGVVATYTFAGISGDLDFTVRGYAAGSWDTIDTGSIYIEAPETGETTTDIVTAIKN